MSSLTGSSLSNKFLLNNTQLPLNSFWREGNHILLRHENGTVFIKFDNTASSENQINNRRLIELEQKFSRQFISHILEDDFEYGMDYKAHIIVKEQMKINSMATKDWLNRIFTSNYENPEILIGILRVIARFEKAEIYPIGETMALASLSHKDETVQETAIRVFESWGGIDSLKLLENVSVSSKWVKNYLDEVISDLKAEYVS